MKQILLIIMLFCAFSVSAQVKAPKGFDVGGTIIDANEVRTLNGMNGNIKDTLDSKVRSSAVTAATATFYTKAETNNAKSNVTRLSEIGSSLKTLPFGYSFQYSAASVAVADGTAYYSLQEPTYTSTTATGIKCGAAVQGVFTEDNFCGAALVEVNGDGTYSAPVAISANLPGQFKLTAGSVMTFPFITPYVMNPNKMYVAVILCNWSGTATTAPGIYTGAPISGNLGALFSPTKAKTYAQLASQATIPTTSVNISSLAYASNPFLICIY